MERPAADVALSAYQLANGSALCQLKFELCVPALLLEHNFSVGVMMPPATVVRPSSFCVGASGCGRSELARWLERSVGSEESLNATPVCSGRTARLWNVTERTRYWAPAQRTLRHQQRAKTAPSLRSDH